jgi:amino acid transporter
MGLVNISLAEMASMAPTSGGQYHWVSEFSPPQYQQYLSHLTGWMSTLSWQAGTASGPFLVGTLIQALIEANYPNYDATNWQGTLFVFAVTILVYALNVWGSRAMPMIQNLMLIVHIGGFLAIMIVFWVLSPHVTADVVFTMPTNAGGWSTVGLSLMVGQLSAIYGLICKSLVSA